PVFPRVVFIEDFHGCTQEDIEASVDEHLEQALVARAGDHVEPGGLEDVDVDPSEAEAVAEAAQVLQRPDGVEARLLALPDEEDAVTAEVAVHRNAHRDQIAL